MADAVSRFRPGGNQRGEDTRQRILETALVLFGAEGFDGASTRELAERAGVNLPAIQYYFGSKEGLYRAVVEQIAGHIETRLAPLASRIRAALTVGSGREDILGLLCELLDLIVAMILDDTLPDRESRRRFFARTEFEPMVAADALQDCMVGNVLRPCAALVGRLVSRPADDEGVLMRAIALLGQAKGFNSCGAERMLGWDTIGADRVRAVQALLREHTRAVFAATGELGP
ncbi:MAG: CerR family C-terminal domain-containing protein [Alphaproteobacteria bacterium]|nr:CerR family C-terminal domain-containing protein [Alphaproteobacteria bacterium]